VTAWAENFAIVASISRSMQYRLPGLKYQRINDVEATAEFNYKPPRWKEDYRFVVQTAIIFNSRCVYENEQPSDFKVAKEQPVS
jgi:hypothetical protein